MARDRERQKEYNRTYYATNRERIRVQHSTYNLANRPRIVAARKGLTAGRVQQLLGAQGGKCAICASEMTVPHIDHDHSCCSGPRSCGGCVRGLLCASCNHMLGKAHDKPEVLEAAAAYLRRFPGGNQ
jgi:hypothetical protein